MPKFFHVELNMQCPADWDVVNTQAFLERTVAFSVGERASILLDDLAQLAIRKAPR